MPGVGNMPDRAAPWLWATPDFGRIATAAMLAPRGVMAALSTPRVWRNYQRLLKPTVIATVVTHVVTFLIALPFQLLFLLLWVLSFGQLPGLYDASRKLGEMGQEVAFMSPLVVMLLFRTVYSSSITKCFFDSLQVVNPREASRVQDCAVLPKEKPKPKPRPTSALGRMYQWTEWVGENKVVVLMAINTTVRILHRSKLVGFLAAPASAWVILGKRMHPALAICAALLCTLPAVAPLALKASEAWRGAVLLSQDLVAPYTRRVIRHADRRAFYRKYEPVCFCFGVPFYLLMNVRYIGSLTFILAQASAATLCDYIANDEDRKEASSVEERGSKDDKAPWGS